MGGWLQHAHAAPAARRGELTDSVVFEARGFAFATFKEVDDAKKFVAALTHTINGQLVRATPRAPARLCSARPRPRRPLTPPPTDRAPLRPPPPLPPWPDRA